MDTITYLFCWISVISTFSFVCIDAGYDQKTLWFTIHSIVNLLVFYISLPDLIELFLSPLENAPISLQTQIIVMALHLSHILVYKLNRLDWIHHVVMMSVVLCTFIMPETIKLCNAVCVFMNGLPGGIDYGLMSLVRSGKLDHITEKKVNSFLNVYIRSPGIICCIFIGWLKYLDGQIGQLTFYLAGLAVYWNAQYFLELVVYAYGQRSAYVKNNI